MTKGVVKIQDSLNLVLSFSPPTEMYNFAYTLIKLYLTYNKQYTIDITVF